MSRIVRGLAQPLLVVVAVATLTAVYEMAREARYTRRVLWQSEHSCCVTAAPALYVACVLSLALVLIVLSFSTLPRLHALCLWNCSAIEVGTPPSKTAQGACAGYRPSCACQCCSSEPGSRLSGCAQEGLLFFGQLPALCLEADQAFNLTSFALSLLLVFRTNTGYSRWLEARKVWGGILNRSRDLVRQVRAWVLVD